jgi:outer membrane protein assembly factor BamD
MCLVMVFAGCGGSKDVQRSLTAEERFEKAKSLFDNEDYLEAINEFQAITLQFPGSSLADDAQFYLGECHFERREYLLAAYEYSELKRSYPASPLVADAQFKLGMAYFELSPPSRLDQKYTRKALEELQTFVEYYPSHAQAVPAEQHIQDLTDRLAKKSYETAQLYKTMELYRASAFYYEDVIEKYHDTEYAPLAYLGKAEVLIARKKYREAEVVVDRFISVFPNSVLRGQADKLKRQIDEVLEGSATVTGKDSGERGSSGAPNGYSSGSHSPVY